MNDFLNYILTNNVIAYTTAFIIFVVTVFLVVKRLIGFVLTLVLLFFAIASGLAIANMDLFREILRGMVYEKPEDRIQHAKNETFKDQVLHAYDELKSQFEEQKKNLQDVYDAYKSKKAETPTQEQEPSHSVPKETESTPKATVQPKSPQENQQAAVVEEEQQQILST